MNRKLQVKNQIESFITGNHVDRLDMCTFGIEIETQCDDNDDDFWTIVYDNLDFYQYMDEDSYYQAIHETTIEDLDGASIMELLECLRSSDFINLLSQKYRFKKDKLYWRRRNERDIYRAIFLQHARDFVARYESLYDVCTGHLGEEQKAKIIKHLVDRSPLISFNKYDQELLNEGRIYDSRFPWYEDYEESVRDNMDDEDYRLSEDYIRSEHPDLFPNSSISCDNSLVEIVEDQSITGVEFRTIGGLSIEELEDTIDDIETVINDSDHYIDTDCSAHIHIKLGDIKHYYGDGNLHAAIMEYIAFNFDRLPESVRKRLRNGGNRWIYPYLSQCKYRWVNFHDQGTIEFRLFGNTANKEDLLQCIRIAVEALAYGYQVRFGDYERALDNKMIEDLLLAA